MTAAQKIGPDVSNFLAINPEGSLEVVVVLKTPQPEISLAPDAAGRRMTKVTVPPSRQAEQVKARVIRDLKKLRIKPVNWLDNANSFVAVLTAEELRAISNNPAISEIIANENLTIGKQN